MSHNSIEFFAKYIEKETGIVFQDINLYQLKTRLEEIVEREKAGSVDQLCAKFQMSLVDSGLKQRLLDHSTNNETLFFRDPAFFSGIENFIIKEVLPHHPKEIKIWSAAASTGQEALSVAMVLDELSKKIFLPPVSIMATDLSRRAINRAKSGIYNDFEVRRGLSDERRNNYFTKESDGWHVKPSIHQKIKFDYNNLIQSTVNESFHLILCRNVLIYQKVEMKKMVIESLYRQLDNNGGILLGVGETLLGIRENVESSMIGNVIFYKKTNSSIKKTA